jgi:uncharacterized protein YlxW (UPF0749 family)
MDYTKVIDYDYLVRDNTTGAIINTDKSVFEDARKLRNGSASIKKLQTDVEDLKNEISDIKNLLREFIRNGNT